MKAKFTLPHLLAIVLPTLALALGLACWMPGHALRTVSAAGAPPLGSYSYLISQPTGILDGVMILGVLNFDGAGNLSGTYTSCNSSGAGGTGSLTGSYTTNANGGGNLNLTFDNGVGASGVYATNTGGAGMQILLTGGVAGIGGTAVRQ